MYYLLFFTFTISAIFLIIQILIQKKKSDSIHSFFESGASSTFFGSSGSGDFMFKLTIFLSFLFFLFCILFSKINHKHNKEKKKEFCFIKNRMKNLKITDAKRSK